MDSTNMNVIEMIKQDHANALQALNVIQNISTRTTGLRDRPWESARKLLWGHMYAEEAVVYPALQKNNRDRILEAIEEHNIMKILINQMDDMPKDLDIWSAKLKVLTENLMHHIKEEEILILRPAEKGMNMEQLRDLGRRFEAAKETAPR